MQSYLFSCEHATCAVPEAYRVWHDGVPCMDQRGDGACVALDPATARCTIYERRPQTCRDFARGGELCLRLFAGAGERSGS